MGTFRPVEHDGPRRGEPKPKDDLSYEPPDGLTPSQAAIWRRGVEYAPKGLLKEIDWTIFLAWVVAFDQHETARAAQARLDARGGDLEYLMKTRNGEMMVSPYLGIMNRSGLRMMKAASELGFSPASRPRISIGKDDDQPEDSGWSRLQVIQGGRE